MPLGPIIAIITAYGYLLETDDIEAVEIPDRIDGTDLPGTETPGGIDEEIPPVETGNGEMPGDLPPGGGGAGDNNDLIIQCINAGGTWNDQFQQCDLLAPPDPEPPQQEPEAKEGPPTIPPDTADRIKRPAPPQDEGPCGPRPATRTFGLLGHTWVQESTCNAGWIAGDLPKIQPQFPPGAVSIDRGGFNQPLIDWVKCACREGIALR